MKYAIILGLYILGLYGMMCYLIGHYQGHSRAIKSTIEIVEKYDCKLVEDNKWLRQQ